MTLDEIFQMAESSAPERITPAFKLGSNARQSASRDGHIPSPRRAAAGKKNWAKRRGFTPEGLDRLRQAALQKRPWERSTGPKTAAGKAVSARNRRRGKSLAALCRELLGTTAAIIDPIVATRRAIEESLAEIGPKPTD